MMIKKFEIYMGDLDPAIGCEMQKTRPVVVVSPNGANSKLGTVVVVPLTSTRRNYPFRISLELKGKKTNLALDQIRVLDKSRLTTKVAVLKEPIARLLSKRLQEMFICE